MTAVSWLLMRRKKLQQKGANQPRIAYKLTLVSLVDKALIKQDAVSLV